jgi:hypothetical protein
MEPLRIFHKETRQMLASKSDLIADGLLGKSYIAAAFLYMRL